MYLQMGVPSHWLVVHLAAVLTWFICEYIELHRPFSGR